ncbi:MAG: polymer-forming cytoskeletal protein [Zoogloeaceae bacterium]|jgi:cytoskeletal protein CcmA (bactofilin family)|nr:polymer-forming cytoskeletal protein [Zoogloeaceae bacterium]
MFSKKNNGTTTSQIESLIGQGTRIEGNVMFSGGLRVDGEICGKVVAASSSSTLMLSEHGVVNGHVDVAQIIVNGVINGPVRSSEFLELHPKARIVGDIEYRMIEIQQGALIEGRLILVGENDRQADTAYEGDAGS